MEKIVMKKRDLLATLAAFQMDCNALFDHLGKQINLLPDDPEPTSEVETAPPADVIVELPVAETAPPAPEVEPETEVITSAAPEPAPEAPAEEAPPEPTPETCAG